MGKMGKLKGGAKGIRALKGMFEKHKKAEEEYEGVVATLQSQITNYVGLEKTPTLTEDRLEFLDGKIAGLKGCMTSDAFLAAFQPLATAPHNFAPQLFVYKLRSLFYKIHKDNHLRIHSELAFNIGCNMADIIMVEKFLVRKWFAARPAMCGDPEDFDPVDRLPFPPIVLLVTFIFITPLGVLNSIFHTNLEERPEHGSPPTFSSVVINAMVKSEWPVLVNWVGTLTIMLTLPLWFPEIDDPMFVDLNFAAEENQKTVFPFLTGMARAFDKHELDVVEEHRAALIAAAKGKGKKPRKGKGADKGSKDTPPVKPSPKAAPGKADAAAEPEKQQVCRLPICIPRDAAAKEESPAAPAPPVPRWGQQKKEEEREAPPMDRGVFDLSDLVLCPQVRQVPEREGLLGPLVGGAARFIAKAVALPSDTVALFTPFTSILRPPAPPRRGSDAAAMPPGLEEKKSNVIRYDCEWSEVYGPHLAPDIELYPDDNESDASSRATERLPVGKAEEPKQDAAPRPKVFRELTEEDESAYKHWLQEVGKFALKSRDTSERLNKRLHEKLREPFCCTRHIYEQLRYYCPENKAIICSQCTNEKYSGKAVTLLTHHCATEINRFARKEDELKMLVRAAGDLAKKVPVDKSALHKHVDDEIDMLISALNERRDLLHKDINRRQETETTTIKEEMKVCLQEKTTLDESFLVLEGLATGNTRVLPLDNPLGGVLRQQAAFTEFWERATAKLHQPMGIPTLLKLLLPAEELMKNAERLDWSVPKQYLSNRMYPPPGSKCPTLPTQVSTTLSTVKCSTTDRSAKLVKGSPAYWARVREGQRQEELRTREVADNLESLWGLVYSKAWRRGLIHLFAKYKHDVQDIIDGKTDTSRIQTYKDFFHEYRRTLQGALNMHVADGKYNCARHKGVITFRDVLQDLAPLGRPDKQRLVCVDTIEAARSLTEFVLYVRQYHLVHHEGHAALTPSKVRPLDKPLTAMDTFSNVDSSSLYSAPLGVSRRQGDGKPGTTATYGATTAAKSAATRYDL
eukprot:TRINITY_DN16496_c0_g1_i1.p1 TRINITY_DN16496_c0_g1~~TRINITY_DN16496_c0_g1_i1.p1  ORF type:complete len:1026 (+),score=423.86 TRINITY_DN16496_c0_g1_i1:108-3185(+)